MLEGYSGIVFIIGWEEEIGEIGDSEDDNIWDLLDIGSPSIDFDTNIRSSWVIYKW